MHFIIFSEINFLSTNTRKVTVAIMITIIIIIILMIIIATNRIIIIKRTKIMIIMYEIQNALFMFSTNESCKESASNNRRKK